MVKKLDFIQYLKFLASESGFPGKGVVRTMWKLFVLVWLSGCMPKPSFINAKSNHTANRLTVAENSVGLSLSGKLEHLSYPALKSKLVAVTSLDSSAYSAIENSKYELGAHNYANGDIGSRVWSPKKLNTWIDVISPICSSKQLGAKYGSEDRYSDFVEKALGRPLTISEVEILTEAFELGQFPLVCLTILSSLEFVSI